MPRRDLSTPLAASSFDQNDPKKNSTSGATTTSPISDKAKADIKKTQESTTPTPNSPWRRTAYPKAQPYMGKSTTPKKKKKTITKK